VQQQISFGNDRKKNKNSGKSKGKRKNKGNGGSKAKRGMGEILLFRSICRAGKISPWCGVSITSGSIFLHAVRGICMSG